MTAAQRPPLAQLRERVLTAARDSRAAGRAVPEPPEVSPLEAFHRAVDALSAVLVGLGEDAWRLPVLRDLDVQGLVGHLTGVEEDVHRALAGDPAVAHVDHVASTQATARAQAGRRPDETLRAWRTAVDRTVAAVRGGPDRVVAMHGLRLPADALLVVRTFELWTHENDIRAAVGLPPSVPDPSTLHLMTELAVRSLPQGVARAAGMPEPVAVHLVLTGVGGGTWDVVVGGSGAAGAAAGCAGHPELLLVTDVVGFCRLVADRVAPASLDTHLDGEVALAGRVLAGAAALALD